MTDSSLMTDVLNRVFRNKHHLPAQFFPYRNKEVEEGVAIYLPNPEGSVTIYLPNENSKLPHKLSFFGYTQGQAVKRYTTFHSFEELAKKVWYNRVFNRNAAKSFGYGQENLHPSNLKVNEFFDLLTGEEVNISSLESLPFLPGYTILTTKSRRYFYLIREGEVDPVNSQPLVLAKRVYGKEGITSWKEYESNSTVVSLAPAPLKVLDSFVTFIGKLYDNPNQPTV